MNLAQNFSHLDAVSVASLFAAGALAVTRLLTTAKPIWDRLPKSLQGLLPVLVLVLPQLAEQAAGVKTTLDLTNLLFLAVAMILPGWHSHTVGGEKTGGGAGAAVGLVFVCVLMLPLQACSVFNRQNAKTVVDIAHELCVAHYAKEKPAISLDDVARTYCKDLDPWVDSVLGAERLGAAKAAAKAGATSP